MAAVDGIGLPRRAGPQLETGSERSRLSPDLSAVPEPHVGNLWEDGRLDIFGARPLTYENPHEMRAFGRWAILGSNQ